MTCATGTTPHFCADQNNAPRETALGAFVNLLRRSWLTVKTYQTLALCAIAVGVGTIGCDQTVPTQTWGGLSIGINPGTRLSPKLLLADDGTIFPHPTIWIDSEYGECTFRLAFDGKTRCLPNAPLQKPAYFLDPSCIQEVFLYKPQEACVPMAHYGLVQIIPPPSCVVNGPAYVVSIGEKVVVSTIFAGSSESCGTAPLPSDHVEVYLVSGHVMADEFVSAWSEQ
jgi:hypothetical protein